jgi:hypothetical protein
MLLWSDRKQALAETLPYFLSTHTQCVGNTGRTGDFLKPHLNQSLKDLDLATSMFIFHFPFPPSAVPTT